MRKFLLFNLCLILTMFSIIANADTNPTNLLDYYDKVWQNRDDLILVEKAVEDLDLYVATNDDVEILWRLSRFYYWLGEKTKLKKDEKIIFFQKGKLYAEQAVNLAPGSVDSHFWLASLTGKIGETQGILQSLFMVKPLRDGLEKVISLDKNYAPAYHGLAILYRLVPKWPICIGNPNTSLEYAQQAVLLAPENLEFWLGLAETYLALNDKEKALDILEGVIKAKISPQYRVESEEAKINAQKLLEGQLL